MKYLLITVLLLAAVPVTTVAEDCYVMFSGPDIVTLVTNLLAQAHVPCQVETAPTPDGPYYALTVVRSDTNRLHASFVYRVKGTKWERSR